MTDTDTWSTSTGGLISPADIPFTEVDPVLINSAATSFISMGNTVPAAGADVVSSWSGLSASYEAPEAGQLMTALDPVAVTTAEVGSRFSRIGAALSTFSEAITAPRQALRRLRAEAEEFVASVRGGITVDIWDSDHPAYEAGIFSFLVTDVREMGPATIAWDKHQPSIDRNNGLIEKVNTQVALIDQARADCVDTINALHTLICIAPEIALTAEGLNQTDMELPWGTQSRGDRSPYESFGDGLKDSFNAFDEGASALFALAPKDDGSGFEPFRWDAFTSAWSGLGQTLGAVAVSVPLILSGTTWAERKERPKWVWDVNDWATEHVVALAEGFTGTAAQWENDPAYASGFLTFNVATAVPAGGAGTSIKVGTAGARAAQLVERVGAVIIRANDTIIATAQRAGTSARALIHNLAEQINTRLGLDPAPAVAGIYHALDNRNVGAAIDRVANTIDDTPRTHVGGDTPPATRGDTPPALAREPGPDTTPVREAGPATAPVGQSASDVLAASDRVPAAAAAPTPVEVARQYVSADPLHPGQRPPELPTIGETSGGPGQWQLQPSRTATAEWAHYQSQITGIDIPPGGGLIEYRVQGSSRAVDFDGTTVRGDPPVRIYLEAKHGYETTFDGSNPFLSAKQTEQFSLEARSQLDAITDGGRLEWHFSNRIAADAARQYFRRARLPVDVVFTPIS